MAALLEIHVCGGHGRKESAQETRPPCDTPSVLLSLDLDAWINEPPSDSESEDEKPKAIFHEEEPRHARRRQPEEDEEELARVSMPFQEHPAQGRSPGWALKVAHCQA